LRALEPISTGPAGGLPRRRELWAIYGGAASSTLTLPAWLDLPARCPLFFGPVGGRNSEAAEIETHQPDPGVLTKLFQPRYQ
jgi:hypothetical protein